MRKITTFNSFLNFYKMQQICRISMTASIKSFLILNSNPFQNSFQQTFFEFECDTNSTTGFFNPGFAELKESDNFFTGFRVKESENYLEV